jgi:large subunit ribosomal protein L17
MRHSVRGRKLGRVSSHRIALFRNQLASLVEQERIITTLPKAKELRPIAERVITQGKSNTVHARRLAGRWVADRDLLKKLFDDIAPRMSSRPGGYLRIVKLGPRQGDGAEMAVLELVDYERKVEAAPEPDAKGKKGKAKAGAKAEEAAEGGEETAKPDKPAKQAGGKSRGGFKFGPQGGGKTGGGAPGKKQTRTPRKAGGE